MCGYLHPAKLGKTNKERPDPFWPRAENRLVALETLPAAAVAGLPRQKLEFVHDGQGRRVAKKVSNWSGTAYTVAIETRFIYDGWNLLAEVNALATNAPIRTYVWGLDLSGSTQGAGGVGGLLAVNSGTSTYAAAYDGNGNVSALVNAADGTLAARYDYNAFGERVITDGLAALINPFRFSTKYEDPETGLLYYGFRYYNPSTGRWLSRDPIEETGGLNLYGMVANNPINYWDYLGLDLQFGPFKSEAERQAAIEEAKRQGIFPPGSPDNNTYGSEEREQADEYWYRVGEEFRNCWSCCMKQNYGDKAAGLALMAAGLDFLAGDQPKTEKELRKAVDASRVKSQETTRLSRVNSEVNKVLRKNKLKPTRIFRDVGRALNPITVPAKVGAVGLSAYVVGLSANCAAQCGADPTSWK
jgi:RHS repeat-associated protein